MFHCLWKINSSTINLKIISNKFIMHAVATVSPCIETLDISGAWSSNTVFI